MVDKQGMLTVLQTSAQNPAGLLFLIEIGGKKKRQNNQKRSSTVILNETKNMIIKFKKGEIILITKGRFKNSLLFI